MPVFEVTDHGPITRLRMARTLFGRVLHDVCAYQIGNLLIDTGPPAAAGELLAWCRERRVEKVVLTHHHEDHVGGAARLQEALGVPVLAPGRALPILLEGARIPLYRRAIWGRPRRVRAELLGELVEEDGYRFRVIPTPGHAFDHVCLFEPERRWLLSGDLFVHERVRFLRRIEDLPAHLDSLRRVLALGPELLLCAHAGLVADARGALERKIRFWEDLGEKARALAARGLPEREITRRLLGGEELMTWMSLGDFSKRNLVRALLAATGAHGTTSRRPS